jgi:tripartite-type tricarboxylate transporter receptor subunit TctC
MIRIAAPRRACRFPSLLLGLCAFAFAHAASAEDFPSRPLRLLVPYAAGGTTDIVGRVLAQALGKELGQPVIVENRAGAGGIVGAAALARSDADGYTLGIATVSTLATGPLTTRQPIYDPLHDFSPLSLVAVVPNVLTVNPGIPAKTVAEFVDLIHAHPHTYSYASSGVGSIAHLDGELFKALTKSDIAHIPYRGSGPALNDTAAGQVAAQFDNLSSSLAFIKAGKLRALAVASAARVPELPDVPTYAEAGLPAMNNMAWFGLVGPKGLPPATQKILVDAATRALATPALAELMQRNGALAKSSTPAAFAELIQREYTLRKKIIDDQHIVID